MAEENEMSNAVELATELTIAWLSNPNTRASAEEVPGFLRAMHEAVGTLSGGTDIEPVSEASPAQAPAVSVRKSLASKDFIVSMIDGKPYKTLRRHLARHGLTPEQYRERFGLKSDYPMVSESYSNARREMAKKIGLGRKPGMTRPAGAKKPGRKPAEG
ncbi:MucR family transcriptional regulator [Sphingomonas floccifaciens]|uniref:MucR family transcriptional regulator n=1 Tax=Sphingomonas floccifaciens TaxID=1844115 RepID=A0ABW4NBY8_9SPHN